MKCCIPEISWHNRDPVLSVDIQPNSKDGVRRLATGGTDSHVLIWSIALKDDGTVKVEFLSDLQRHQRSVNAVRFSPNGDMLASGDDEAVVILWAPKPKSDAPDIFSKDDEVENKENWNVLKVLRGHTEDVYDLCWSPDSLCLMSGSVDNTAILWDVSKGRSLGMLSEHKGFVQGVTWDPKNHFVATMSSDRCCRVYSIKNKKLHHKINQAALKLNGGEEKTYKLFHDDTLKTFCRRLCFTPDGSILLVPCGFLEPQQQGAEEKEVADKKKMNAVYAFTRGCLNKPAAIYPTLDKYSIAVRSCPLRFQLRPSVDSLFSLPYRMVFAVATQNSVLLYDTQQAAPFARIARIHYTRLTDLAWSSDGRVLTVSSTDGYCSLISFAENELGVPYVEEKTNVSATAEDLPQNFQNLLQGEIQRKNLDLTDDAMEEDFQLVYEETSPTILAPNAKPAATETPTETEEKTAIQQSPVPSRMRSPRRVQLITLSSPKQRKN